jgi:uncharacterized protein YggT (Ycf19 family)
VAQVVSGLKSVPLLLWLGLTAAAGADMLYRDLNGWGLSVTIAYHTVGIASYPIFYGSVAWLLAVFALMWWHRHDFLRVDGGRIIIGWKAVPFEEVREVVLRTNVLGVSRVAVVRKDGREFAMASYFLSQPTGPTIAKLRELIPQSTNP